uniref:NF-kappa-B inhibitor zeta n=1 Tax=Latimeria chalumnae TaxID=7897 RepID=H3AE08_LATCH
IAESQMAGERLQKGSFQGVRVKNSVKELLVHFRTRQMPTNNGQRESDVQEGTIEAEQFAEELKTILQGTKRNASDNLPDVPLNKRTAVLQAFCLLTPPHTPTSVDNMDDNPKPELRNDSSAAVLQNIINIKNESSPVSLNTVQVSWSNMKVGADSQGQQYQGACGGQTFSQSPFQVNSPPQFTDQSSAYQCPGLSPPQSQDMSQCFVENAMQGYLQFAGSAPSTCYQQPALGSQQFGLEVQNHEFLPFATEAQTLQTLAQPLPGLQQVELYPPPSSFTSVVDHTYNPVQQNSLVFASPSLSPPHLNVQVAPLTVMPSGKSFFQWQLEQEENKLIHATQEQILARDFDGDTLLHISVAQGRRALSYVLARKMAALNALDVKEHNGQSALQVAIAANQHLIVQDLVAFGAQVNTTDCWGRTPFHVCAEKGHTQVLQAVQKGVIANGQQIDLEATNYDGMTALHCAVLAHNAVMHELQLHQQPHSPEVQELIMKRKNLAETVKTLIQMGTSVEAKDRKSGRTAVHLAAEEANVELLRIFLELSNCLSFVNEKAYNGNTALHVAASLQYRMSQLDAVRLLMRKGADPSAKNLENEQPIHLVPDGPLGEQVRRVLKGKTVQPRTSPF